MKIPPQLRPTAAVSPRPHTPPTLLYRVRRGVLLLRVLALCVNAVAHAQPGLPPAPVVTPEQKFAPGYLEAVSTGYENGQALNASEGVAPVRPPRSVRTDLAPSAPAVPAGPSTVSVPLPAGMQRVNAR
ncbi:hypothetical protein [Cupriavidus sp. RAF12]|uniref:hypothetical protein n=1 Tax=Cupriavidus sp. RAF12 TaxID=3233050 RepID=UPI003F9169AA